MIHRLAKLISLLDPTMKLAKCSARVWMLARRLDYHHFLNVHLETSAHCNRRCHYCPQSQRPFERAFMSEETLNVALRRIRAIRWKGPIILAVFNEPLLDTRLIGIVKLCTTMVPGSVPQIFSNGDLLTLPMADALVEAGLKSLVITPHPPYKPGWTDRIASVVNRHPSVVKVNGGITPYRVGGLNALPTNRKTDCDYQDWSFVIRHDGKVPLCCIDYNPDTCFGNILKEEIYDIWYNPAFVQSRRLLRQGKPTHAVCQACFNPS